MFILGIDQGSTQTRAAICDERGQILGLGIAAGACHSIHGMEAAMHAVQLAAEAALSQAGLEKKAITRSFAGLSGADWPDEYGLLHENLLHLGIGEQVKVVNDCLIALRGGTQANYGAIVIAGTGANCAIRSPAGQEWIYHYYIEGSLQGGVALGKRALEAIYKAETGRLSATRLTAGVLALFDLPGVDRLLREQVEGRLPADRVKDIAPLIFEFAGQGDIVSAEIIRSFGAGLAELVTAGLRRLEMAALEVEVVLSGSIFKGPGRLLQEVMLANIYVEAPHARLVDARYEPVVGALLLGLEESGFLVDAAVKQNIEQGSQKFQLVRPDR